MMKRLGALRFFYIKTLKQSRSIQELEPDRTHSVAETGIEARSAVGSSS
jgi:hypothetical protein